MNRDATLRIFKSLFKKRHLANFYIFDRSSAKINLRVWVGQLLKEICGFPADWDLWRNGHPDVLAIAPTKDSYLNEDLDIFFDYLPYHPQILGWRFLVVDAAEMLSQSLCHKMLKSLEAGEVRQLTIIFLNKSGKRFMETVESRSLHLTINADPGEDVALPLFSEEKSMMDWFRLYFEQLRQTADDGEPWEGMQRLENELKLYLFGRGRHGLMDLVDYLKRTPMAEKPFLDFFFSYSKHIMSSYEHKKAVLDALKWYEEARLYHLPSPERLFRLAQTMKS